MELTYTKHGDYYIPDLDIPAQEKVPVNGMDGCTKLPEEKQPNRVQRTSFLRQTESLHGRTR